MAQRYWDYTERERAGLTAEQVEAMLTVELMEKGVVKVDAPVLEEVDEINLPRDRYYAVEHDGRYSGMKFDCVFRTIESAQAFIDLQPIVADYDYQCGDKFTYAKVASNFKIVNVDYCREQDVVNVKARLQKRAATQKANSQKMQEYNAAVKAASEATEGVWDDWREKRTALARCQRVVDTFKEYTAICDGDEAKAMVFLKKAYSADAIAEAQEWFGLNVDVAEVAEV